jgi:hypothetical protein
LPKGSYQQELDNFFAQQNGEMSSQVVTKSALSQAQKQLSHTAFTTLNRQVVDYYYAHHEHLKTWHGHRLCAIDGSQLRVPNAPDITSEFGVLPGKPGMKDCPMALASVYFDVLNRISIDTSINPTRASERDCAAAHLQHALSNDLSILDRGYNAFWLYALFSDRDQRFCMRAKINRNLICKVFSESGEREQIITLTPNKNSVVQCKAKGLSSQPLTLRLVRVDLDSEVEVLITNLLDSQTYPAAVFKELYHLRWGIEENYKRLKQWVEIENFSGKSALSVRQDFYAKIVSSNLVSMLANSAQRQVDKTDINRKLRYQINAAQAMSKMKNTIIHWLGSTPRRLRIRIGRMVDYIACTIESVRAGRSYVRPKSSKNRIFYMAYKRAR